MNQQIPNESASAARSGDSFVGKIMIYYTIIIRRNQHLFATFHSKIAKLFNPSACRSHSSRLLVKSYNSLFLDRYPTASGQKHPGNSFLFLSVHQGQTFQVLVKFQLKTRHHDGADRCTCNEAGFSLHFAGFLQGTFIFLAPNGISDPAEPGPWGDHSRFSRNSFSSAKPPWGQRTSLPLRLSRQGVSRKAPMPSFSAGRMSSSTSLPTMMQLSGSTPS